MSQSDDERNLQATLHGPPSGYFIVVPQATDKDGDGLAELIGELWRSWRLLAACTIVGAAVAVAIALMMRDVYRAQAIIAPVHEQGGAGGLKSQLGGLAALAGVDIGAEGGRKEESIATLSSAGLTREFIQRENLLPVLFAERWDAAAKQWRSNEKIPTLSDGVRRFMEDVRSVNDDRKTNLVTVTVEWYQPDLAAKWANGLVELTNERLRAEAMAKSELSTKYLNDELAKAELVEARQALFGLLEGQINNAMMATVQHDYAFHFIDRAVPAERKFSPKRAVISLVGAVFGFVAGIVIVYARRRRMAARAATNRAPGG
jgi:uncharacterized protein involved in exopolysaccharide biosynthesis